MRNRSEQPQKRDGWKTAFWALVIVLVGAIVIVGAQALMPVKQTASSGSSVASNNSFDVSLNKDQLNSLSNFYLNKVQKNQKMKYEFTVNDEAVLGGSTKILGANVNFALALQPVVLKKR
ncbi:DUF2140 family protein [Secundilactobacillus oryzae]|uniref:DUF2140 family protein n=1 Tax=Secundilactobacillus oryzae TaxID=1202668 RepID=UPI0006D23F18|nr:DUF2140 family protein [Secundilactobacillus oryzae]